MNKPMPIIRLAAGGLHVIAEEAEGLLKRDTFVRGHRLVRVSGATEGPDDGITRAAEQPVIVPVSKELIRNRLNERAEFQKYDARGKTWHRRDCPTDFAQHVHALGEWKHLPPLDTIASAPFLRPDLTVCSDAGYDAASRTYLRLNGDVPPVPDAPTRGDAAKALDVLLETFEEFPFADDASESTFVAHVLTEAARIALPTAPAFWYTAATPGAGKTLLAEMPARIVHGGAPAQRAWVRDEEQRKTLFSALLAGDRSVLFDNLPAGQRVFSTHIAAFTTAPIYSDRVLGDSKAPSLANRATLALTGINLTPAGELARRSIVVRLDVEGATGRQFRIADLRQHVDEHRGELLCAALTIIRAYVVAGCPVRKLPLPSFEQWSRLVRGPLIWLGIADPVETQDSETDDESDALAAAFAALAVKLDGPFTSNDIAEMYDPAIVKALKAAGCKAPSDAKSVGYWIRQHRDRVEGGVKLVRKDKKGAGRQFEFRKVSEKASVVPLFAEKFGAGGRVSGRST